MRPQHKDHALALGVEQLARSLCLTARKKSRVKGPRRPDGQVASQQLLVSEDLSFIMCRVCDVHVHDTVVQAMSTLRARPLASGVSEGRRHPQL